MQTNLALKVGASWCSTGIHYFSCYTISLGNPKYSYDVSCYLNSEDSSNYSPKSDHSLKPHTVHFTAYWTSLLKSPQRHQTQHGHDNSPILSRLVLKACLSFCMPYFYKQHAHSPRPKTWMSISQIDSSFSFPLPLLQFRFHSFLTWIAI